MEDQPAPPRPLTAKELVDRLYEQHDREVHQIFMRLMGIEEPDE